MYGSKGEDEYIQYLEGWEDGYLAGYNAGFPDYDQWLKGASGSDDVANREDDDGGVYDPDIFDIVYRSNDDYVALFYVGGTFRWEGSYEGESFIETGEYEIEPLTSSSDANTYVALVFDEIDESAPPLPEQQEWMIQRVEASEEMPGGWYDEDEQEYYYWRITDTAGRNYEPTGYYYDE
jgi:hypothetical protein